MEQERKVQETEQQQGEQNEAPEQQAQVDGKPVDQHIVVDGKVIDAAKPKKKLRTRIWNGLKWIGRKVKEHPIGTAGTVLGLGGAAFGIAKALEYGRKEGHEDGYQQGYQDGVSDTEEKYALPPAADTAEPEQETLGVDETLETPEFETTEL